MGTDAQFGVQAILRPYSGFESMYQGKDCKAPLIFNESVVGSSRDATDPLAGTPGYSPRLLGGFAVPFGARVQVLLPGVLSTQDATYTWQIVWRMRNPRDASASDGRLGWNFPKFANGTPETIAAVQHPRVLIPALYETIVFGATAPVGSERAVGNLHIDVVSPQVDSIPLPYLPSGARGVYEQGVIDPGGTEPWAGQGGYPSYSSYFTNAKGNELVLALYRTGEDTWDFANTDALVAALFGASSPRDLGVYVSTGSAP